MSVYENNDLECESCGDVVKPNLSPAEQQKVADNPDNFVVYCYACIRTGAWRDADYD